MGILGAVGAGLAEAGGAAAQIGMAQVRSAIEEERSKRLAELQSQIRLQEDTTTRERNKADTNQAREEKATRMRGETERLTDESRYKQYMQEQGMTEADIAEFGGKEAIIASLKEGDNYAPGEIDKARLRADAAMNVGDKDEEASARGMLGLALNEKRADANDAVANRRADIAEMLAEKQIAAQNRATHMAEVRESNLTVREQRAATAKALDGVNADIKSLEKEAVSPMLDDAQKKVVERQLTTLRSEAERYRAGLAKAGVELPEPKAAPMQDVRVGGKVIGQARTPA